MKKKFIVRLTATERQSFWDLVKKGRAAAYRRTHAQVLLLADESEDGPSLRDAAIAEQVGLHERTVSRLRQRCVEQGLESALSGKRVSGNGHGYWMARVRRNWLR